MPTNDSQILVAENLTKNYGGKPAQRRLSFSLQARRILGLWGPNGAGKTTAIHILTTILEPTSGQFQVGGVSSTRPEQIRRKISVLPESLGFPPQMTGVELLAYSGQHYGRKPAQAKENAVALLKEVGLPEKDFFQNGGKSDVLELQIEDSIGKNTPADVQLKNRVLYALVQAGIPVLNFDADRGNRLQDIFFQLTEDVKS